MKTAESSDAKAKLDILFAEIAETGEPITITERGRPVAMLTAVTPRRRFGQLPGLVVPENLDDPLPGLERPQLGDNRPRAAIKPRADRSDAAPRRNLSELSVGLIARQNCCPNN
jgi:prevent-host-death family protein